MAIHEWSDDCQSNCGVRKYSDIREADDTGMAIHVWSRDCQSNSGVQGGGGYSGIGVHISGSPCTSLDCQSNWTPS